MTGKSRNKFGIRYAVDGPPNLAQAHNQILDALDALYPQRSVDIYPIVTKNGTNYRLVVPRGSAGAAAAAISYPFDIAFSAGSDGSHSTATIRPGTINGLIPTNYADTYDVSNTATKYLVLSASVTDGEVTSCSLSLDSSAPAGVPVEQGQPPTSFAYLLGIIVNATWFRTVGNGSLAAIGAEMFRISKTAPDPGTLPYDIWYTWTFSNV